MTNLTLLCNARAAGVYATLREPDGRNVTINRRDVQSLLANAYWLGGLIESDPLGAVDVANEVSS